MPKDKVRPQLADDDLMSIADIAERLSVSSVTVANWIKDGRLPSYQFGERLIRVRYRDFKALVEDSLVSQ